MKGLSIRLRKWHLPVLAGLTVMAFSTGVGAAVGVDPAAVNETIARGGSIIVNKTVTTPEIPPNPDIVFLADSTGSMGGAIANVRTNAGSIMSTVVASQPTAQFAVADYKDKGDVYVYQVDQDLTSNQTDVQTAINAWAASGGGDFPEAQLIALEALATGSISFRADSTRIIVWFGDAPGHEAPEAGYPSRATVITALQAAGIQVIAVDVASLDSTGQATAITSATGGSLETTAGDVSAEILAALGNLPITVYHSVACDPGLTVTLSPASQTVTSGDNALFTETIAVDNDPALEGTVLNCTVTFADGLGNVLGVETIEITVPDTTPPVAACTESVNPNGNNTPNSGVNAGKSGQNPDGFYLLSAKDNLSAAEDLQVYVVDTGSGTVFGPYPVGTVIKYTEAPGATPSEKTIGGPDSAVTVHITGTGDAAVYAVDEAGNVSARVSCLVPPQPK